MNGYINPNSLPGISQTYQVFRKTSDFNAASPAQIFLFGDVQPQSICTPAFIILMPGSQIDGFYHYPATHHNRAGVLAFSDGHIETHRWLDPRTFVSPRNGQTDIPHEVASPANADVRWLQAHSTIAVGK